ncbi:MAG: hypothetical protein IKX11_07695 [Bacteroidales bacterium]|jgi:hypothetical protein|nr:hypothetical protein [Bacteroidales bacterium]
MAEHVVGKTIFIDQQPIMLYSRLSNLESLADRLPEDKRQMVEMTHDSVLVKTMGMEFGMRLTQSIPFNTLVFEQMGQSPFPFQLILHFDPAASKDGATDFHLELNTELNTMLKMMLGSRLQPFIDNITDIISQIAAGNSPGGMSDYVV